jgi:hypothetical protein
MEYLIKLKKTHDTFNQNDQWNFNQVRHLVKMVNVTTTYRSTHQPTHPLQHTYLHTHALTYPLQPTYLSTHPHTN